MEETEITKPSEEVCIFSADELASIKMVKLVTGEELLASVLGFNEEIVLLKRPCKLMHVIVNQRGDQTLMLQKWNPYSPDVEYVIPFSALVNTSTIEQGLLDFYLKNVELHFRKENDLPDVVKAPEYIFPEWMDEVITKKDKTRIS